MRERVWKGKNRQKENIVIDIQFAIYKHGKGLKQNKSSFIEERQGESDRERDRERERERDRQTNRQTGRNRRKSDMQ